MLASLNAISRQQDKSGPITTFYHIPGIKTQWKKNTEKKKLEISEERKDRQAFQAFPSQFTSWSGQKGASGVLISLKIRICLL